MTSPKAPKQPWGRGRRGDPSSPKQRNQSGDGTGSSLVETTSRSRKRVVNQQAADFHELTELAAEATDAKVQAAKMLVQTVLSDLDNPDRISKAIAILGEVLRHMKEINRTPVTADNMKVDILKLRAMKGENSASGHHSGKTPDTGVVASLRTEIEFIPVEPYGTHILHDIGWSRDDAKDLLQYIDVDQQGNITETDIALMFEFGHLANSEDMMIFHVWVMETFEHGIPECYDALNEESPWGSDDVLSRMHFEKAAMEHGYGKNNSRQIFNCLDSDRRSGFINSNEFGLLRFFVAFHALKIAELYKTQLCKKYKSLEGAFKALSNEHGIIPMSELQELGKKWKVVSRQAASDEAYHFLKLRRWNPSADGHDKEDETHQSHTEGHRHHTHNHENEEVTRAELLALEHMSATTFRHELRKLCNHIMLTYGSFDAAFAAFVPRKAGLTHEEFVVGYKQLLRLDTVCDLDPDVLFHFLDLYHDGILSKKVFSQLSSLNVEALWDDLAENRDKLLKRFRGNAHDAFARLKGILHEKKLKEATEEKMMAKRPSAGPSPTLAAESGGGRKGPIDEMRPAKVVPLRSLTEGRQGGSGVASPKTPGTSRHRGATGSFSDAIQE